MPLRELIDQFRSSLLRKGRSANTARAYVADMKIFVEFATTGEYQNLQNAAEAWLTQSRKACESRTVLRRAASLASFSKELELGISLSDYKLPTTPPPDPHPLPNGMADVKQMISACRNPIHRGLIAFGGYAGLRVSESIAIKPSWIDLTTGKMKVHGKGDKYRVIPITGGLRQYLLPLFIGAKIEDARLVPLEDRFARGLVTTVAKRAGVPGKVSSHDLRATFATVLYDKTHDINMVRAVLGHASVNTTLAYLGVSGEGTRKAMEFDDED